MMISKLVESKIGFQKSSIVSEQNLHFPFNIWAFSLFFVKQLEQQQQHLLNKHLKTMTDPQVASANLGGPDLKFT